MSRPAAASLRRLSLRRLSLRGVSFFGMLGMMACGNHESPDTALVSQGVISVSVPITGQLRAVHNTSYGPPQVEWIWSFKIAQLAEEGSLVKKGDLLVVYFSSELEKRRIALQSKRESAQATLDKKKIELSLANQDAALSLAVAEAGLRKARLRSQQSSELSGNIDLAVAKLELEAATDNVSHLRSQEKGRKLRDKAALSKLTSTAKQATRDILQIDKSLGSMTSLAKEGGTVVYKTAWGNKVKVGDDLWKMDTALELASLDQMMGQGMVAESDSAKIAVGQEVKIRLESEPDQEIIGHLTSKETTVHTKSEAVPTKVIDIELSIETSADLRLRPGMRFRGDVEIDRAKEVTIAPLACVFPSASGPIAFVEVEGGMQRRSLQLGRRDKRGVEVRKGLRPGDKISCVDLSDRGASQ